MPIYEYKCGKCNNVFEVLQKSNKQTEKCPKCKNPAKKMVSSRVGFQFKGAGFYSNDYKKSSSGEQKEAPAVKENKEIKENKAEKETKKEAVGGTGK